MYAEFGDHTSSVTQVKFSYGAPMQRAFSCSIDKTFKVYDLPSKTIIKQMQAKSAIIKLEVDHIEQFVYLACDNSTIYQNPLGDKQPMQGHTETFLQVTSAIATNTAVISASAKGTKKVHLPHRRKVTAMCLSTDGNHIISGDAGGLIYIWSLRHFIADSGSFKC